MAKRKPEEGVTVTKPKAKQLKQRTDRDYWKGVAEKARRVAIEQIESEVKRLKQLKRRKDSDPTREQYVIGSILVAAIQSADALYGALEGESERCNDPVYMDMIKDLVLNSCSRNMVENLADLMAGCLGRAAERAETGDE
jgi:hypothetical protein